jgi:pimeloyl-ACP methyl ester carboxylesterase
MNNEARSFSPAGRFVLRLGVAFVAAVLALGAVVWRAPIWVGEKLTQLKLYRFGIHGHSVTIDGHRIYYVEGGGNGTAVVLIHGLGSHGEQDWSALAPYLVRAGYHVYAPDLLGFGKSEQPADATFSMPEQAKIVEDFLDAEHLDHVDLAGVSMGGWVASEVALAQPERVERLLLFDSAGMDFRLNFDRELFTPQTPEQVDQLMALVTPDPPWIPGFLKAAFIRESQRNGWVVRRALDSMMEGHDYVDGKFSALKMPMLIVWGKQDVLTPLRLGEEMHREAPQSVLAICDGCGHIAAYACVERVAPTVLDFLAGSEPQPGQTITVSQGPAAAK